MAPPAGADDFLPSILQLNLFAYSQDRHIVSLREPRGLTEAATHSDNVWPSDQPIPCLPRRQHTETSRVLGLRVTCCGVGVSLL
ncbi:hypothetical protein PHYPO_G00137270, partial [Pangasianodon hypophthalmus]